MEITNQETSTSAVSPQVATVNENTPVLSPGSNPNVSDPQNNISGIRTNLVNVAVQFLQNPKVEQTTITQRRKFLQMKGLTDLEIDEAFKKSRIYFTNDIAPPIPPYQPQMITQPSLLTRIKDYLTTAAAISALLYGAYMFYKRYILPFLFGKRKPKKSIESEIQDLSKAFKETTEEIRSTVLQIQSDMGNSRNLIGNSQLEELKSEIHTVKSLLLSKKQFPLMATTTMPPSIPAWQLASAQDDDATSPEHSDERDKSPEDIEVGSGGSSETEVITKNNSDSSSIEIM